MSLITLRDAIAAELAAAIPELKTCEGHGGRFDLQELRRVAAKAPAVFVACLGFGDAEEEGDTTAELSWAAYVVTKDAPGKPRDEAALAIAQALAVHIPGNRWGLDDAEGRPEGIRGQNLYSDRLDKQGVAMWAISWRQRMNLGGAVDSAELAAFVTFHAEHSMAPGDGEPAATDEVTLPQE